MKEVKVTLKGDDQLKREYGQEWMTNRIFTRWYPVNPDFPLYLFLGKQVDAYLCDNRCFFGEKADTRIIPELVIYPLPLDNSTESQVEESIVLLTNKPKLIQLQLKSRRNKS